MQELILRSDVEKMLETKLEGIGNRDYGDQSDRVLNELIYELSQLESKYEAVAYHPEYILANRIWKSIDTPPHTEGQYLVIDEYVPGQRAIAIGYFTVEGWGKRSYTHWMALPRVPSTSAQEYSEGGWYEKDREYFSSGKIWKDLDVTF